MNSKQKSLLNNKIFTEKEFMDIFSNFPMPDGVVCKYSEKDHCIEFRNDHTTFAVLVNVKDWEQLKQEIEFLQERKRQEAHQNLEMERLDKLTKLYNKEYSRSVIEEFLSIQSNLTHHALMIVDIDNFNIVNESLGYLFGDTVLVNVADSLRRIFKDTDITSRIGEDEFLIFLKNVEDKDVLLSRADEICSVLQNTYTGENKDYSMSCSVGIAVYPNDGMDYEQLFIHADAALKYIQQEKHDKYSLYNEIAEGKNYCCYESYDQYKITKTKAYGTNSFDKEITAFAFDIMSRTKDVNSAINLLLNRMRVQFDCNHICIIENSVINDDFHVTYLNSKDGVDCSELLNEDEFINILDHSNKFDENGIFYANNTNLLQLNEESDETKEGPLAIKAVIQCAIFEDGVFKGCVSVDDCEKPRFWTQSEVDSLVTITKIISSYLLKLRASERANNELYRIRNYDALTGLPTLHKFKKDVRKLLMENMDHNYAIIYSDISQFKYVNDALGYDIGDSILCDFARHLKENQKQNTGLARSSEDNFLAVVKYNDEEELKAHILEVNEQFNVNERMKYPAHNFIITSGVSIIEPSKDISIAIDNANIARKSVKNSLKTACKFFDHSMKIKLQKETEITNTMENALKNGEFIVYLQPKIELRGNTLVGAEALVRWLKKDNTLIPPNDFIPLFEKNGFVVFLDFYVYEEVCKKLRNWLDNGLPVVPISLNVSRIHLNDENFVTDIEKLVDSYKIPHNLLELELTESIFLNNTEEALTIMHQLRKLGFGVSIDDFGAGYSSLNLLKDMSTDVIKLDKEFFGNGEMQKEEQIIVASIISMAKQLNMKVLSEGVETKKQSDFLKSVCCDMAQGFLYSRPMPMIEFEKIIHNKKNSFKMEDLFDK